MPLDISQLSSLWESAGSADDKNQILEGHRITPNLEVVKRNEGGVLNKWLSKFSVKNWLDRRSFTSQLIKTIEEVDNLSREQLGEVELTKISISLPLLRAYVDLLSDNDLKRELKSKIVQIGIDILGQCSDLALKQQAKALEPLPSPSLPPKQEPLPLLDGDLEEEGLENEEISLSLEFEPTDGKETN